MAAIFCLCLLLTVGCFLPSFTLAEEPVKDEGETPKDGGNINVTRVAILAVIIVELIAAVILLSWIINQNRRSEQKATETSTKRYIFHETETDQDLICQPKIPEPPRQLSFDLHHANKSLFPGGREELYADESLSLPDDAFVQDDASNDNVVEIEGIIELEDESSDHWPQDEENIVPDIIYTNAVSEECLYIGEDEDFQDGQLDETSDTSLDTLIFVGNIEPYQNVHSDTDNIQSLSAAQTDCVTSAEEDECDSIVHGVPSDERELVGFEELLDETSDGVAETDDIEDDDDDDVVVVMTDGNITDCTDNGSFVESEDSEDMTIGSNDSEDMTIDSDYLPLDVDIETDTDVNSDAHSLAEGSTCEGSQERNDKTNDLECHRESLYKSYISSIANDLSSYKEMAATKMMLTPSALHNRITRPKERRKTLPTDFLL